jgi:Uracil DNA glycosylase superfamily
MDSNFLRTKFSALGADGVERFPKPTQRIDSNIVSLSHVKNCVLGSLKSSRKAVVVSKAAPQKRVFCILEYPDEAIEQLQEQQIVFCESFLSLDSQSSVMKDAGMLPFFEGALGTFKSLISKLNLVEECYVTFAIKCVPRKGIPKDCAIACAESHLNSELQAVSPQVVLVFGKRASEGFELALQKVQSLRGEIPQSPYEVHHLPSILELFANPSWRAGVWNSLVHLKLG